MLANRKALKAVKGQLESVEAFEQFKAALVDLEAAMISADTGILKPTKGKDESLVELAQATQELGKATKNLISTAKNNPEELGTVKTNKNNSKVYLIFFSKIIGHERTCCNYIKGSCCYFFFSC